jgi:hypothetical protein
MEMHLGLGRAISFGGLDATNQVADATWTFGTSVPGSFSTFGGACSGPAGTPQLTASAAPWIGTAPTLTLAPAPVLGVFALGGSSSMMGTLTLPASLAPIGMPGCSLLVSLDTVVSRLPNGAVATLPLPIPYSTQLIAQQFFVQGASLDAGANALGITVSNALAATIGWL